MCHPLSIVRKATLGVLEREPRSLRRLAGPRALAKPAIREQECPASGGEGPLHPVGGSGRSRRKLNKAGPGAAPLQSRQVFSAGAKNHCCRVPPSGPRRYRPAPQLLQLAQRIVQLASRPELLGIGDGAGRPDPTGIGVRDCDDPKFSSNMFAGDPSARSFQSQRRRAGVRGIGVKLASSTNNYRV